MRCLVIGLGLLLAGCGEASQDRSKSGDVADVAEPSPEISITAAPGVAFNYAYDFRLPPERIAAAQKAHAQACEKLGITRCRITGMRYALADRGGVDAMLSFKLDPTLARGFGKQGIAAVEAAEGMLTRAQIGGSDAGSAVERLRAEQARLAAEREQIGRDLARPGLGAEARAELVRQRAALDQSDRTATAQIADHRESLATTPVTFLYESGRVARGFDGASPLSNARDLLAGSAQWTLAVTLGAIALLGPPALALAVLWFGWRVLRRRMPRDAGDAG